MIRRQLAAVGAVVLLMSIFGLVTAPAQLDPTGDGAQPSEVTRSTIEKDAMLVQGAIRTHVELGCIDLGGGSTANLLVGQRTSGSRVLTGQTVKTFFCESTPDWFAAKVHATADTDRFHAGRAFAILEDTECTRDGDCGGLELSWRELKVHRATTSTPRAVWVTTAARAAVNGARSAQSAAGSASMSIGVGDGVRKAGGAGAVVPMTVTCSSGEGNSAYSAAVHLALRQYESAGSPGSATVDAPAYNSLPCDGAEHAMRVPLVSTSGYAFHIGSAHVEATYSVLIVHPDGSSATEVTTTSQRIMLEGQ